MQDDHTIYSVYLIRNSVNGKVYVGSTSQKPSQRFGQHQRCMQNGTTACRAMSTDWKKFGSACLTVSVIETCPTREAVLKRETYWIRHHNATNPKFGYNKLESNPEVPTRLYCAEACAKISAAKRGLKATPETRAKMVAAHVGMKRSAEAIAKTAAAHRGRKRAPDALAKMSVAHTGHVRSLQSRAKQSISMKAACVAWKAAKDAGLIQSPRRKVSAEGRAKLSAARMGRKGSDRQREAAARANRERTPEQRAKAGAAISATKAQRKAEGRYVDSYRPHGPEARAKISAAANRRWAKYRESARGITGA